MTHFHIFLAISLDGFIAREDGSVDWLFTDQDYGYTEFYKQIDTVILGRKTYEQTLAWGDYPYQDKRSLVFSRSGAANAIDKVEIMHEEFSSFLKRERRNLGEHVWVVGGGELMGLAIEAGVVSDYCLAIHPILLGRGIPMFSGVTTLRSLQVKYVKPYENGLIQVHYCPTSL